MAFDEKEFHAVVLGALFHDIGKFVQRAQENPTSQNHSSWGEEWFQNNLAEKLTSIFSEKEKQIIRSAIANHHEYEEYVSLADAISAGMDRIALKDEEEGDPFTDRLVSIFSRISISDNFKFEKFYRLASLGCDQLKEVFPIDEKKCTQKEYSDLLKSFEEEIRQSNFDRLQLENIINIFYFLLWKYCWCIPSSTYRDEPDVPLFDHLKTTAAIASCLYLYKKENQDKKLNIEEKTLCLIGGDISGIQNYIFDVLTQQGKVAKRLRSRSLFIQIASEIASHKVLHAIQLTLCNLILSAGGNFFILAPNLKNMSEMIKSLQEEFDDWSLKEVNGELSVSLSFVELSGKDLNNFPVILEKLKIKQSYKKYHPIESAIIKEDKWLMEKFVRPEAIESDQRACRGCHKFPVKEPMQGEDLFCERCSYDVKIGQLLPRAKYIAFFKDNLHEFRIFNYSFELWQNLITSEIRKGNPYLILTLNSPEIQMSVFGFKYLTNHVPTTEEIPSFEVEKDQPVTFNDIAKVSKGDKLIAYLKGDVDNMGKILREGLKKTKPSISRFATLSRLLETFFGGYLQNEIETDFKQIYTVFSGGDDFFVIGPWDRIIDFAKKIRDEFSRFCARNPDLTFSAGVILVKPHEPISYCAEMVEKKLKDSKGKGVKNNITLFNQTVSWDELGKILSEGKRIINWLQEDPPIITRSFIYNLRKYGEMAQESGIYKENEKLKTEFLKFIPHLVHDIKRNLIKENQKSAFDWAEDLLPNVDKPKGGSNLYFLKIIMDYVLTYTRS